MHFLARLALCFLICYMIYYNSQSKAGKKKSLRRKFKENFLKDDVLRDITELEETMQREPPKALAREMSLATFVTLSNLTESTRRLTIQDLNPASRRNGWSFWWINTFRVHPRTEENIMRMCYVFQNTYRSASYDIRDYFPIRYLYQDTLEYEVGYLTHEIVYKYQTLLELYYMVGRRFYHNWTYLAPVKYFFYVYQNVIFVAQIIIKLCDMMQELPAKYRNKYDGPFDDYHIPTTTTSTTKTIVRYVSNKNISSSTNTTADQTVAKGPPEPAGPADTLGDGGGGLSPLEQEEAIAAQEKAAKRLKRLKAKQNKLRVMSILAEGMKQFEEVKRQPKISQWQDKWNKHYGWSMETEWWKSWPQHHNG